MRWFRNRSKLLSKTVFDEYCSVSSVHGVRYFSDPDRTMCEKFWWVTMFLVSIGGCAVLIWKTCEKWSQTPIIMAYESTPFPISDIPFPSVTICPPGRVSAFKYNFSSEMAHFHNERLVNLSDHVIVSDNFLAMLQLCNSYENEIGNNLSHSSYYSVAEGLSIALQNYITDCSFRAESECDFLLQYVLTDIGFCVNLNILPMEQMFREESMPQTEPFIFNYTHKSNYDFNPYIVIKTDGNSSNWSSDPIFFVNQDFLNDVISDQNEKREDEVEPLKPWNPDDGYHQNNALGAYPYRGFCAGRYTALHFDLHAYNDDISSACDDVEVLGYRILLHSPADYPRMLDAHLIPLDHRTDISVKPVVVKTGSELRSYAPERRQCFFHDERYLKYFKIYSQNNCELECLSNYTLERCGCVKFSMVRSDEVPVCETIDGKCLSETKHIFNAVDILPALFPGKVVNNIKQQCKCLPACTTYQYDVEIANHIISRREPSDKDYSGSLTVYFKEAQFIAMRRSALYGLSDFIANFGGLLGLLTGTSLLSLVEIVYFCLIRPCIRKKKRNRSTDVKNVVPYTVSKPTIEELY